MPVNPPRRLVAPTAVSLYDEISRDVLSSGWSRSEVDQTERKHPQLVVRSADGILAGLEGGGLAYSFGSQHAFVEQFPTMFEQLLPKMRREFRTDTVRFRLMHNPARPVVEPVLKRLWFEPSRSWLQFTLPRVAAPRIAMPNGVKIRASVAEDIDEMIALDRAAFPNTPMPQEMMRKRFAATSVLVATAGKSFAGFAMYQQLNDGGGYLNVLAVGAAFQRRGIGAALTLRVASACFAAGAQHIDLKTDDTNSGAIALYRRLGFQQTLAGRDYARSADPRQITKLRQTSQGAVIRFGGWR